RPIRIEKRQNTEWRVMCGRIEEKLELRNISNQVVEIESRRNLRDYVWSIRRNQCRIAVNSFCGKQGLQQHHVVFAVTVMPGDDLGSSVRRETSSAQHDIDVGDFRSDPIVERLGLCPPVGDTFRELISKRLDIWRD